MPHASTAVIGDEHAAVLSNSDANRTAPHGIIVYNEACKEILVAAVGLSVMHGDTDHLIPGALFPVPRTMFCLGIVDIRSRTDRDQ
jgi:hypothetical protein